MIDVSLQLSTVAELASSDPPAFCATIPPAARAMINTIINKTQVTNTMLLA
jgi:hypothetical protein